MISVEARPPGVSLLSTINQEGPFYKHASAATLEDGQTSAYKLVHALRSSEARGTSTNDEDVDIAATLSVHSRAIVVAKDIGDGHFLAIGLADLTLV